MSREQYFNYIHEENRIKNNKPWFYEIIQGRMGYQTVHLWYHNTVVTIRIKGIEELPFKLNVREFRRGNKNGQSKETGNTGYTKNKTKTNKTILITTI